MERKEFNKALEKNYVYLLNFAKSRHMNDARARVHDMIEAVSTGSYKNFKGQSSITTWLTAALLYVNIMHERRAAREPDFVALYEEIEAEDQYAAIDLKVALEKMLKQQSQRAVEIFRLIFVEGHSLREAGEQLGVSHMSVQNVLQREIQPALAVILADYSS